MSSAGQGRTSRRTDPNSSADQAEQSGRLAASDQSGDNPLIRVDRCMELAELHVLVIRVRNEKGPRPEEQRRPPPIEQGNVRREREGCCLHAWNRMQANVRDLQDCTDWNERVERDSAPNFFGRDRPSGTVFRRRMRRTMFAARPPPMSRPCRRSDRSLDPTEAKTPAAEGAHQRASRSLTRRGRGLRKAPPGRCAWSRTRRIPRVDVEGACRSARRRSEMRTAVT